MEQIADKFFPNFPLSLNVSIQLINNLSYIFGNAKFGPWINQQNSNNNEEFTTYTKCENDLLSIRYERQKMIRPNCHLPIMNVIKIL